MHMHGVCLVTPCFASLQVVFLGLGLVIPLVTGELLQFPKLVRSFYNLMSYMLEIYPEHVAALPGAPLNFHSFQRSFINLPAE